MASIAALTMTVSSCGDDEEENYPNTQTVAHIFYQVRGHVTDTDGQPLAGIAVMLQDDYGRFYMHLDSVVTDQQGYYATSVVEDANLHQGLVVIAKDIDGQEGGGLFRTDTLDLTLLPKRQVGIGDDAHDSGQWELTGDFTLQQQ
jgi:putative lipoprotein (rSAM/lipoprotein system)